MRVPRNAKVLPVILICLAVAPGWISTLAAQSAAMPATACGYASKRPIIGGACPFCPWGALADKVKLAMQPLGYDVQVCYNCSGADSIRMVDERRRTHALNVIEKAWNVPPPPDGEVDFGVVNLDFFTDAYKGVGLYQSDHARPDLRLIARIEDPDYYLVATRAKALISDMHDIKQRKLPVRILADHSPRSELIFKYYGIDRKELESWGGAIVSTDAENREDFDVIISFTNMLNNTPESNVWYELSQKNDLRFVQLPDDLLQQMAATSDWEIGLTPLRMMRGMDRPIKTVMTSGNVIYGRADMPEQFAYDVAKAMDESRHSLIFSILAFSYDPELVWKARNVPLHPGAERYYREMGYIKGPAPKN